MATKITIKVLTKWSGNDAVDSPNSHTDDFKDISNEWYEKLSNPSISEIIVDGKCRVEDIFTVKVNRTLKIVGKNNAQILFGTPYYDHFSNDRNNGYSLFELGDGAEVSINGIDFCLTPQSKGIAPYRPTIFRSVPDHGVKWTALVKNCDTTSLGVNGGMGLGLLYGSSEGNYIGAINFKHAGSGFIEGKANIGGAENGVLYMVLDNVKTDGLAEGVLSTHKFLVEGRFLADGNFRITSGEKTSVIFNHFFNSDNADNYAHILHAGRFTFMLDDNCHLNDKEYRLRPMASGAVRIRVHLGRVYTIGKESHAGDSFVLNGEKFFCLEKGRDENDIWTNSHKPKESDISYTPYLKTDKALSDGYYDVQWNSSFYIDGDVPVWILYKESKYGFRSYPDTKFEDWEIMSGEGQGHNMYNHKETSIWARNVIQSGYYRQTSSRGKFLGCNMVNCEGFGDEFSPPQRTSDPNVEIPERIKKLL